MSEERAEYKVMDVVRFTRTVGIYTKEFTYFSNKTIDTSGDYVPLAEYERLQSVLKELIEFNPLRNDRDAYLLALSEWGIKGKWGVDEEFSERPQRADFGLE